MKNAIVCGSSGFIGTHLVRRLKQEGYFVVGVDIVEPKYERPHVFFNRDLRNQLHCAEVFSSFHLENRIDEVYNLACIMGGMGFIGEKEHSFDILVGSTNIVTNVLNCSIAYKAQKVFYASSACVYNEDHQSYGKPLSESLAYPASPDLEYGWQKLISERMHTAANVSHGLNVRIARFHNIYGPEGTYTGGKEKAPAAMLRKAIEGTNTIEIWGDGEQTRSFLFINDCIGAVRALMESDFKEPINIGSEEMVSINELADIAIGLTEKDLVKLHLLNKPQGVRGRNSDNTLIRQVLGWEPQWTLKEGMTETYAWLKKQMQ